MVRIEKTQINASAFIILISTLKDIQSDKVIEIINEGKSINIRKKEDHEKEDFSIDLTLLEKFFGDFVASRGPKPLIIHGKDEEYLRNLSHACDFFQKENHKSGDFDHFGLFHNIHFRDTPQNEIENVILRLFCGLFRIEFKICQPFIQFEKNTNSIIQLPVGEVFNKIFERIEIRSNDKEISIAFESCQLKYGDALNTLFSIKDLLFAKGIDISQIPEQDIFPLFVTDIVKYHFHTINNHTISIVFKRDFVSFEMSKNKGEKKTSIIHLSKTPITVPSGTPRNSLCPCGSGKKYKRCHGLNK